MSWPAMGGQQATVPMPGGNGFGAAPQAVNPGVMIPSPTMQPQQPAMPTGQFTVPAGSQSGYGLANLPPMPQQQGAPAGFMGQVPLGPMGQYGLPGAPPQQVGYQQMPAQGYGQQPAAWPGVQPAGQPGLPGPQQAPPMFAGYPQQVPAQQVPGAVPPGVNGQTRLDGPNVPPELRGRTLSEAMAMYNSMATMAQGYGQRPAQQAPQQAPQQPTLPAQQQPVQQGQGSFWQNPEQRLEQIMEGAIDRRLGPVVQFTHMQAVTGARMAAQQQVPDFSGLEQEVTALVANANPDVLANPNTWIGAADIVRGRQMREGRYRPGSVPPQQAQQVQQAFGAPQGPNSQQLPVGAFFTESPAAPAPLGVGGTPVQPTQQDVAMAQKFKMPIEEWMAWRFGVQPATQPNPGSTFLGQQQPAAPWHYGPYTGGANGAGGR